MRSKQLLNAEKDCGAGNAGSFKISAAIASHMVLQREKPIKIWGTADLIGMKVFIDFMDETVSGIVNQNGDWLIELSPRPAVLIPQTMRIYTEYGTSVVLDDILIGDVYFITGQSNAELGLNCCIDVNPEDRADLSAETIRLFAQFREYVFEHSEYWAEEQKDIINPEWSWKRTTESSALPFSALGYYFGKELSKTIQDIPIGLIMAAAGGAQICELMPRTSAEKQGYSVSAAVGIAGYYNTLIHPFIRMPIKAMIFYQGESECNPQNCGQYASDLRELVAVLRARWGQHFPFYNMQLASHGKISYEYWPSIGEVRAAQYQAMEEIPDYYLSVAMDSGFVEGDPDFAHPRYKKVLGQRLAKLILATEYHAADIEYSSSPYLVDTAWDDHFALLTYKYVGDGLRTAPGQEQLIGFQTEENGTLQDAKAEIIDKNTVKISFAGSPSAVCYGLQQLAGTDIANLMNSELLPAPAIKIKRGYV